MGYLPGPRHAHLDGFDLHANVTVRGEDREGLEQLCRHLLRPAVAQDRLRLTDDGHVVLQLKTARSDSTSHLLFEAVDFLARLAALILRPSTTRTKRTRSRAVGTVKKSIETRSRTWLTRNVRQFWDGGVRHFGSGLETVRSATLMPSFRRSEFWRTTGGRFRSVSRYSRVALVLMLQHHRHGLRAHLAEDLLGAGWPLVLRYGVLGRSRVVQWTLG
jgi:hypothetical protein